MCSAGAYSIIHEPALPQKRRRQRDCPRQHRNNESAEGTMNIDQPTRHKCSKGRVLRKKRPLDKVFHSLVVGNEIVRFRQAHGEQQISRVHPSTGEIERAISATIESLQFAFERHLASERIVAIVDTIAKQQRLREHARTAA